ncbi:MAG: septation protein IspZ [Acetobacteraceae bacterium]
MTPAMAVPELPDHDAHGAAPPDPAAANHPLIHAGKFLLADLLSTLIFVALYAATHSIFTAAGLAIALGLGRIAYLTFRGMPIDAMQWLSLFLVVAFGGATLLTHNPVFVMLKPTMIYAAIGAVMLKRGWMNRYVPPIAHVHSAAVTTIFGYLWAALMFATGLANLAMALLASPAIWAWFVGVFPIASKIVLVTVQYVITRRIVRHRIRAAKELALSTA